MSRTAHKLLAGSGAKDAYEIDQSLLVSHADTTKLRRTPSSAGNRKTFTFSTWCKRQHPATGSGGEPYDALFGAYNAGTSTDSEYFFLGFNNNDYLTIGAWTTNWRHSSRRFRDTAAWYHIVLQADTTQSTADNRFKLYVNGVQETAFETKNNPSQNLDLAVNAAFPQAISDVAYDAGTGPYHFSGYMAETHLIDGTIKAPSDFGETDSVTGQWIPKEYTGGSYGTNGYYMKYVSGAIGTDSSGQSNNYTTTNLANDNVMQDSPTNNFSTMNPLNTGTYTTLTQGNLLSQGNTSSDAGWTHSNFAMPDGSGKWYSEHRIGQLAGSGSNYPSIGVSSTKDSYYNGTLTTSRFYNNYCRIRATGNCEEWGSVFTEQSGMDLGATLADDDIISIAVDTDNKKIWFAKNGTWIGSGNPGGNSTPSFTYTDTSDLLISIQHLSDSAASWVYSNYGQDSTFNGNLTAAGNNDANGYGDFKYAVPSGFKAMCTQNLATPTIKKSTDNFNVITYTGTGAVDHDVTGVGFQPDIFWLKSISGDYTYNHTLLDSVRGAGNPLEPNTTDAEESWGDYMGPFLADGIRLNDVQVGTQVNSGSHGYVAWCWKLGGSASSNTDGSINTTATLANTTTGMSISTYGGAGGVKTVGHGLGKVPDVVIVKCRSTASVGWCIYHKDMASDPETDSLSFDTDGIDDNNNRWNDTAPTSSVVTIYSSNEVNDSDKTYVMYAFASIEGFSKYGEYLGNGDAEDGPFVHTGFTPKFIIVKKSSASGSSWFMWDTKRETGNVIDNAVWADAVNNDTSHAEYEIDFLSNGFKIRGQNAGSNTSGATYIYMAWAEAPFKYANAR